MRFVTKTNASCTAKNAFSLQSEKARAAALFEKSAPKGEWLTKRHLLPVRVQWTDAAHSTGGEAGSNREKMKMEDKNMKRKLALALSVVMVLSLALTGCGKKEDPPKGSAGGSGTSQSTPSGGGSGVELRFSTGGDQGTYYGFGSVLAGQVTNATNTKVVAITSGGSKNNIENLEDEYAELGFVQTDVGAYAYQGTRLFSEKVDCFSTVANLYMEQVQIVTLNPDIKTVADLKGKNVSIGDSGSGVYFNAMDVLGAYDLTEKDINPTYQSFGDSAEALQDGKIDAAFVVAGAPTTAITSLAATKTVYLVSLDDEHIDKLIAESPYYSKTTISGAYEGTPDATTVAVGAVVIARDDVSEDDVYNFISTIFENIDTITQAHAKGAELNLEFAASYAAVPYHPGAAKYFAEKGITVPTK